LDAGKSQLTKALDLRVLLPDDHFSGLRVLLAWSMGSACFN
jgi:hypothetical protein